MSILRRFKTIMSANVHALFDKNGNPEKEVKKYLQQLNKDFGNVKAELEAMTTNEERQKRTINEYKSNINKMEKYAIKALERGSEDEARSFLEKKQSYTQKEQALIKEYEQSIQTASQLRKMYAKLSNDIQELESRIALVEGKLAAAKMKKEMTQVDPSSSLVGKMEEEAEKAMYEAEALQELRYGETNEGWTIEEQTINAKEDNDHSEIENKNTIEEELVILKEKLKK